MRRTNRIFGLLTALAIGSLHPLGADLPLDSVKDQALRTSLRQVGLQVMFGDSLRAMVNANRLGWTVFHRGGRGHDRELAYALALQAAAEAALAMERESLWHWEAAQILLPELHSEMLQTYSEIAAVFDQSPFRDHAAAVASLRADGRLPSAAELESQPRAVERVTAATPRDKPKALDGERVAVSYLVDPEGRPWAPTVGEGRRSAAATFTVLQALMSWRYEPAVFGQEPVWSQVTTEFSFQTER